MTDTPVLFEVRDAVAVVTLNDPVRLNPLGEPLQRGVRDGLARVREDRSIRALLLTANGRGFCAGADLPGLSAKAAGAKDESLGQYVGRMMETSGNPLVQALHEMPVPVVCGINGVAAGGGVGLALAGDMVVAARSAYFYLPFLPSLGIVPDMGSSWVLPRAMGRQRALGLALTGEKLSAEKAAQWGLIWECVDDDKLPAAAMALARQLAQLPAHAITEARALFAASQSNTLARQLAQERQRQEDLVDGESFAEGLRAFAGKRKAVFRGRA